MNNEQIEFRRERGPKSQQPRHVTEIYNSFLFDSAPARV